jgi:hypothetical protein
LNPMRRTPSRPIATMPSPLVTFPAASAPADH